MVRVFSAGLILSCLAVCFPLKGFPTVSSWSGKARRWNIEQRQPVLYYRIQLLQQPSMNSLGAIDLVHQAFAEWSRVPGSLLRLQPARLEEREDILVILTEKADPDGESSGVAEFDRLSPRGELSHCRLTVFSYLFLSPDYFKKVSLHEIGHCLGLNHSLVPEAVMSYGFDTNHAALDLDDRAALVRLYGRKKGPATPPSCGMVGLSLTEGNLSLNDWLCLFFPLLVGLCLTRGGRIRFGFKLS